MTFNASHRHQRELNPSSTSAHLYDGVDDRLVIVAPGDDSSLLQLLQVTPNLLLHRFQWQSTPEPSSDQTFYHLDSHRVFAKIKLVACLNLLPGYMSYILCLFVLIASYVYTITHSLIVVPQIKGYFPLFNII